MSKTENIYCRQEVANEWLDRAPALVNQIAERMHTELGKALADKICDGKVYRVVMEKPHIELGDVGFNKDTSVYRSKISVTPIVMCRECKHRDAENGFCEGRGWPMQLVPDDGFCDKGERREP